MDSTQTFKVLTQQLGLSLRLQFVSSSTIINEVAPLRKEAINTMKEHMVQIEENFIQYESERNMQLLKQEEEYLRETQALDASIERIKRETLDLQARLQEERSDLKASKIAAEEIENKVKAAKFEEERTCEQIQRTKLCLLRAIGWYYLYLGLHIMLGNDRLIISFGEPFQLIDDKLILIRTKHGYRAEGKKEALSLREKMALLAELRRSFLNAPLSITHRDSQIAMQ